MAKISILHIALSTHETPGAANVRTVGAFCTGCRISVASSASDFASQHRTSTDSGVGRALVHTPEVDPSELILSEEVGSLATPLAPPTDLLDPAQWTYLALTTPGDSLFLLDTGHSIHNERPMLLSDPNRPFYHLGMQSSKGMRRS